MGGMATMMEIRRGSKGVWLAAAVVGLGIAAVGVWLVAFDTPGTSGTNDDGGRVVALPLEPPTRSGAPLPPEPVPSAPTSSLAELTPADVMGNPDCIMRSGTGHGRDMAVVLVPSEDGVRFAVVDGSGIVFSDELPFHSVQHSSLADGRTGRCWPGSVAQTRRPRMGGVGKSRHLDSARASMAFWSIRMAAPSTRVAPRVGSTWRTTGRPSM